MFKKGKTKSPQGTETIIGPSVKMEGDFEGNGDIIVEGVMLGNLKTKGNLQVGAEAKIKADIEAQNGYVAGEISGNINIKESLELTPTARINGDINTKSLIIEKGARVNGKISMDEQVLPVEQTKPGNKENEKEA